MKTLIGIGNAAIDVTASVPSDQELIALGFKKGACVFPDSHQALVLSEKLRNPVNEPGGAAANVLCAYGALGGKGRFIGKIGRDDLGGIFTRSMHKFDIAFDTKPCDGDILSTRIFTAITPDRERSFASYYGASHHISRGDVQTEWFTPDTTLLIDGYMLMSDGGPDTLRHAVTMARKAGSEILFMPSSLSVIEERRADVDYLQDHCHAIICNESEAFALTQASVHGIGALRQKFDWGVVTCGDNGVIYFDHDNDMIVQPVPYMPQIVVNTNGAGDNFAGGFLYGRHHGLPAGKCLRLGQLCALDILKSNGPRPEKGLDRLLEDIYAS